MREQPSDLKNQLPEQAAREEQDRGGYPPDWTTEAVAALQAGQTVQVRPRGHSMTGRISDGELVMLSPCQQVDLSVNDIVLVRIQGKRFSHIVLHSILAVESSRFLIGSHQGRVDGWVERSSIYGIATKAEAQE